MAGKNKEAFRLNILGFDLDEPIFDVFTAIKLFYAQEYGVIMKDYEWGIYEMKKNENLKKHLRKNGHRANTAIKKAIKRIHTPEFLSQVRIHSEARICLNILKCRYGKKIHIITARNKKKLSDITIKQLAECNVPYNKIDLCKRKEKPAIAAKHGVQAFFDDCVDIIESFLEYHSRPRILGILDRPWNQNFNETKHENVYRVYDWGLLNQKKGLGIMELIKRVENENY